MNGNAGFFVLIFLMPVFPLYTQDDLRPENGAGPRFQTAGTLYPAEDLSSAGVIDPDGEKIGAVADIVLTDRGRIVYFIAELEKFGTLVPGLYLIPVKHIRMEPTGDGPMFRITTRIPERDLILVQNELQIRQKIDRTDVLYSMFMKYSVTGRKGDVIGTIEDLVIDMGGAEVVYAAFVPDATLGAGNGLVAMPWSDISYNIRHRVIRIETDGKELSEAPMFAPDEWPAEAESNWRTYF